MGFVPTVIEKNSYGERSYDIYSRLLNERIIMLGEEINNTAASLVVAQALYLESQDPDKDIYFYINSPGGSITAGFAIYDTMQHIKPDVSTICTGMAASMGSFLLAAGTKGKRFSLPNGEILLHQPSIGSTLQGQATDIKIHADWILRTKDRINKAYSSMTGQPLEKIQKDLERDFIMSAKEAKEYGIIDEIMIRK